MDSMKGRTWEMVLHGVEARPDGTDHVLGDLSTPPSLDTVPVGDKVKSRSGSIGVRVKTIDEYR